MQPIEVFVISLQRSADRRKYITQQLERENIEFNFFDAIDGYKDNHPKFDNYNYIKRLWLTSGKMPSKGELGCYASHYSLWIQCMEMGRPILIIEDDAEVCTGAGDMLINIRNNIDKYGFLRLERVDKGKLQSVESNSSYVISKMNNNYGGTRAYAISPSSAKKLILASERWCMPVDNFIGSAYLHNMQSFLFSPTFVENPQEFGTTIQLNQEKRTPLYRKPSRELYSLYKKIRMYLYNKK